MNASMTSEKRRLLKHNGDSISTPLQNTKCLKIVFLALFVCFVGTVVGIWTSDISNDIKTTLGIATIAGCASLVGGLVIFCVNRNTSSLIPISLSFSAAIFVHLSCICLIPESMEEFEHGINDHDETMAHVYASISVTFGILMTMFIGHSVKKYNFAHYDDENDHEMVTYSKGAGTGHQNSEKQNFLRLSYAIAIALILYNISEGMITFIDLHDDLDDAALIAFALSVRSIPTGVCIALSIYLSSGSKILSFLLCFIAAIAYALGALIGWTLEDSAEETTTDILIGTLFGIIGGIMLYICFVQVLPSAIKTANESKSMNWSYIALFAGLFIMESCDILLKAVGFDEGHHHGHHH